MGTAFVMMPYLVGQLASATENFANKNNQKKKDNIFQKDDTVNEDDMTVICNAPLYCIAN